MDSESICFESDARTYSATRTPSLFDQLQPRGTQFRSRRNKDQKLDPEKLRFESVARTYHRDSKPTPFLISYSHAGHSFAAAVSVASESCDPAKIDEPCARNGTDREPAPDTHTRRTDPPIDPGHTLAQMQFSPPEDGLCAVAGAGRAGGAMNRFPGDSESESDSAVNGQ